MEFYCTSDISMHMHYYDFICISYNKSKILACNHNCKGHKLKYLGVILMLFWWHFNVEIYMKPLLSIKTNKRISHNSSINQHSNTLRHHQNTNLSTKTSFTSPRVCKHITKSTISTTLDAPFFNFIRCLVLEPSSLVVSEAPSVWVSLYLNPPTTHLTHTFLNNHQETIFVKGS